MKLKAFKGLGEIKSRENRVWKGFGSRTRLRLGHERGKKKSRALPCGAWLPAAERRGIRARARVAWPLGRKLGRAERDWAERKEGGGESWARF